MQYKRPFAALLMAAVVIAFQGTLLAANDTHSLAGSWRFQLDPADAGETEAWFNRPLEQRIKLPGSLQSQGFGDDISVATKWTANVNERSWYTSPKFEKYRQPGNVKVPFWLQPDKHYVGAAWYQRDIEIPAGWTGRRVVLTLERPHWETRVWLDGKLIGTNDSLSTAHVYDLGTAIAPGKHTLTVRVDNRLIVNVGVWAHSVSDHTQGNWNGMVGRLELTATSPAWLDDIQAYPAVAQKSALLKIRIANSTGKPGRGLLTMTDPATKLTSRMPVTWGNDGGNVEFELKLPASAKQWDEFSPALQKIVCELKGTSADDRRTVTFGLREITTTPDKFLSINGRKSFLRGTLECCIFPLTGYPPTDVAAWKRIIRICQAHGLNHIRFHSWCPPEAAFIAADELGFYYQVEVAAWTEVGSGAPQDAWLYKEADRILRAYGNHPSFILMPYGNEPSGSKQKEWLAQWINHWKAKDTRRLYTSGSGWPMIDENQFHVTPAPRGPGGWIGKDYRTSIQNLKAPVIVHEMGQWCVYPKLSEIDKYRGVNKAKNFEIFRDSMRNNGLLAEWRGYVRSSGELQALCYKEEIEAAMRTPGVSGIQLLDLHDFPGQGTALVGVLDPFWDEKGYITPAEFKRFFNTTVPLARMAKRVWTTDEHFSSSVECAHFGPAPLTNALALWTLKHGRKTIAQGELPVNVLEIGTGQVLGNIDVDLSAVPAPAKLKLEIGFKGTPFENDWTLWLYPPRVEPAAAADVLVTSTFNDDAIARLQAGGKVMLLATHLSTEHPRGSWTPVFWNRQWFPSQQCQTLGLRLDPKHAAFGQFPTDDFSDWQWEDIVRSARCMVMDDLPRQLRPVVQVIDDWNTNRRLGLAFECQVGPGKLLVCSADLEKNLETRPAARQLRHSLLAYMSGKSFNPKVSVSREDLVKMLERTKPSKLVKLGARVIEVDSEDSANGNVAANAIDGVAETHWHTRWQPQNDPMPHHLVIDMGRQVNVRGITYLPRQDMQNGRIADVEIYCGNDAKSWTTPVAKAKWRNSDQLQKVEFQQPVSARYLKVVAKSEVNKSPFAAIAELDVITDDK